LYCSTNETISEEEEKDDYDDDNKITHSLMELSPS
jgi:hypothetical protein